MTWWQEHFHEFKNPAWFWLLLIIPILAFYFWRYKRFKAPTVQISSADAFSRIPPTLKTRLVNVPLFARLLAFVFLIVALARPQSSSSSSNVTTEGISIVIALDISASMLAEDFKPNRIECAKKVAQQFIDGRPNDLIGLVIFSGESFTQCPITSDHSVLRNVLKDVQPGMLIDGTAIGEGLATAISRVKDAKTKSKVVVLITDGVNNSGAIPPSTAGEIAKTFDVRVYSIGVGTKGMAPYPFKTPFGIQYQNMEVQIDEALLSQVAQNTDGKYFRATGNKALENVFNEIDRLEKSKIEVTEFNRHTDEYLPYALIGLALILLELILRYTLLKSLP
jgi:Ca-activated chloride channel family protein